MDNRWIARVLCLTTSLGALVRTGPALGCGVSGPDGALVCSLAEHEAAAHATPWHVSAAGLYTSTRLRFSNSLQGDQTRSAALLSLSRTLASRWQFDAGLGATLGGRLQLPADTYDFSPGPTAAVGVTFRAVDTSPFVLLTSLASFSAAKTRAHDDRADYEAFDLRLGALVGTTLWDALSPYATARVFGGPIFWRYRGSAVTGTDTHHYQLGAGILLHAGRRLDVFAEAIPLGERSLSAGASVAF
jgi:hypothetical protein